jgi:tetratricopeptide (TPR) repeat protein
MTLRRRSRIRMLLLTGVIAFAVAFWWASRKTEAVDYVAEKVLKVRKPPQIIDPDDEKAPSKERVPRKFDTFAHWVLDAEAEADFVSPDRYAKLDAMIADVKSRVTIDRTIKDVREERKQARRILKAIDETLTRHNVLFPPGETDCTALRIGLAPQKLSEKDFERILRSGMNARREDHARENPAGPFFMMDCDMTSLLYLGIGDALGVELRLVDLPDHMFVRWPLSDGTYMNWDTNVAGSIDDKEYASDYELSKKIRKSRVYLATMTREESRGYVYSLRAARHEEKERMTEALADLETAHKLYPQSTQIKNELAFLYATMDQTKDKRAEALAMAEEITKLEPEVGDYWDTLATAHAAKGDFAKAIKLEEKAMKFAEDSEELAEFRARMKEFEQGKVVK